MHTTVPAQDGASESETESTETAIPPQTSTSGREVIRIEARASGERDRGRETTEHGMSLLSSARATLASLAAEEVPNMSASEEESLASIRERQARTIDAHTSLISAQRETLRAAERTIHLLQDQIRLYEVRSRFTARLSNSSTSSSSLAASSSNGSPQPSTSASTATGQSPSRHFHSAHNALNTRIRAISLDIARQRDAAKDREN
ncbi:hypothetical protein BT69DRAFT_657798 [Atractiella rhizophila]|nr:hypothetical protein BT69DRAFT_657798 [Atractiella rhizophila]